MFLLTVFNQVSSL